MHFPDDSNHPMPQQDYLRPEARVTQGMIVAGLVSACFSLGDEIHVEKLSPKVMLKYCDTVT